MRAELNSVKRAHATTLHDIKLDLDVQCQKRIERMLRSRFPDLGVLGEEGLTGKTDGDHRWVVDPIDGTVNFAYGIPHACVSIALQERLVGGSRLRSSSGMYPDGYRTVIGVVYDPFCDELWTAMLGGHTRLNGKIIRVSRRRKLAEAIVSVGLSKTPEHLEATLPFLNQLAHRVRKLRIMGAGALDLAYVASGRFDAFVERCIRLWDIAAGRLLVECAGGEVRLEPIADKYAFRMIASNGLLTKKLVAAGVNRL
jgi:myo-inositol-1(or 4)-monophosphatase